MKVIATWAYFWELYLADALLIDDYAMNIPNHFMNRMAVITVFQTKTTISLQITFLYFSTKNAADRTLIYMVLNQRQVFLIAYMYSATSHLKTLKGGSMLFITNRGCC